jgi:hypothetical protein
MEKNTRQTFAFGLFSLLPSKKEKNNFKETPEGNEFYGQELSNSGQG